MRYTKSLKLPGEEKSLHRLTIFSFLWACQAFVHLDFSWHWLQSGKILGYIAMAAVILLLFNPRSVSLLGFMALASFADNVSHWPKLSNHTFASGLMNGTILLAVLWTLYRNRRQIGKPGWSWYTLGLNDREATNALLERFAPVMRAAVIIIYLFAVLHKLNWDFLNPAISCGTAMLHDLTSRLPFSPDYAWAPLASIWATLAIELALPVLLLFRKTRHYALALGLPFHLMLGLIGHRKFSAFIFACYFLFTEEKFTEALNERVRTLRRWFAQWQRRHPALTARRVTWSSLSVLLAGIAAGFGLELLDLKRMEKSSWLLWSLIAIAAYVLVLFQQKFLRMPAPAMALHWSYPGWLWLLPALLVFNGMNPYLGLKTHVVFSMYSNLRTEAGEWNHLFMPKWLKVAKFQDDLVEIIDTSWQEFEEYKNKQLLIPYFEFRRMIDASQDDIWVRYLHRGEYKELEIKNGQSNRADFARGSTGLLGKFLVFRPIFKDGAEYECLR